MFWYYIIRLYMMLLLSSAGLMGLAIYDQQILIKCINQAANVQYLPGCVTE